MIRKRKDGRWEARFTDKNRLNEKGKPKQITLYGKTRKEVADKVAQYQLDADFGKHKLMTMPEYWSYWFDTYCANLSPSTIRGYKSVWSQHILPYFGKFEISNIKHVHVQAWINQMSGAEKARKNRLGVLSKMLSDAVINEIIPKNPCAGVRIPHTEPFAYNIYTLDEYAELLSAAEGTRYYVPVVLAGMVGLRRSEIFALQWSDIDFTNNCVTISKAYVPDGSTFTLKLPKSESGYRTVPIPQTALDLIRPYKGIGLIINPAEFNNWSHAFTMFLRRKNLPPTRFHDLRHFNATQMLQMGIPDKVASKRLGHSEINMTKKYQHVLKDLEQKFNAKIDEKFAALKK